VRVLLEAMQEYFRGERSAGFMGMAVGLMALGLAFWLWRPHGGSFAVGLAIPLLLIGLGGALGGPGLIIRTDRQTAELSAMSPEKIKEIERPRMAKVNANWVRLKMVWSALIAVALILIWVVKREWAVGLGLGLLLLTSFLFTVDIFAEKRAVIYTSALEP
jgi:hypothetical protein